MKKKVMLYTAPACPFCMIIKNYLVQNGIKPVEIDISKDKKAKAEMEKKSGQSNVPVTEISGAVIVGYDIRKIKQALGQL
ncbi:MAG: glutaredoxin family protein [Candidatus Aenigmatarchaeota archaeon]